MVFTVFEDLGEQDIKGNKGSTRLQIACFPFSKRSMRRWEVVSAGHFLQHLQSRALGWCARGFNRATVFTFQHIFDKYGAFCDVLLNDELFIIGGDEKDHCLIGWR